jgi:hypothetical protein
VIGTNGTGEAGAHRLAPWGADGGGTGASAVRARVPPPRGAGSSRLAAQPAAGAVRRRRFTSCRTDRSAAGWADWQYRYDHSGASHCAPAEVRRRRVGTPVRGGWHAGPTGYQARRDTQPTAAVTARRYRPSLARQRTERRQPAAWRPAISRPLQQR